jgi:hypothetical protein
LGRRQRPRRDEFGNESFWSREPGSRLLMAGAEAAWPAITAE